MNKVDAKQSGTTVRVKFLQRIRSVDRHGNAIADITLQAVKYQIKDKNGTAFDFDSEREADNKETLAALIEQRYRIKVTPDGGVSVLDANEIRGAVKTGSAVEIAKNLLKERLQDVLQWASFASL